MRVPGSQDVLSVRSDGDVVRLDGESLAVLATIEMPTASPANTLAVAPDGSEVVVATSKTCRLVSFELASGRRIRDIPHGGGAIAGLAWPTGCDAPWWLADRGLHAFGATRKCSGQRLVASADGKRAAVKDNNGWRMFDEHGSSKSLGNVHGELALHPDGATWARAARGSLDIGRNHAVVRSIASPVTLDNAPDGQLAGDGAFAFLTGGPDRLCAFEVASAKPVPVASIGQPGALVPYHDGPELVWLQGNRVSWWLPRSDGAHERVRALPYRPLPDVLHGRPRQVGRWLTQSHRAPVDVEAQLASPATRYAELLPAAGGGEVRWIAVSQDRLVLLKADGAATVREVPLPDGAGATAVSPDRTRIAIATHERATIVASPTGSIAQGPVGVRSLAWIDDETLIGVRYERTTGQWSAVIWQRDTPDVRARTALGTAHSRLLDVSRSAKRALIGQPGLARTLTWR